MHQFLLWISSQANTIPFWYIESHNKFQDPSWCGSAASRYAFLHTKIQRISKIYKGKKISDKFFTFIIFKQFVSQHRMNGCDCWCPDGRLDTNIDQFEKCHISITYASFFIIWHLMSYDAYDIEIWHSQFGWSWCLNDRLDLSYHSR